MLLSLQDVWSALLLLRLYTISPAITSLYLSSQNIGPTIRLKRLFFVSTTICSWLSMLEMRQGWGFWTLVQHLTPLTIASCFSGWSQYFEFGAWRWNGCGLISLAGIKRFLLMGFTSALVPLLLCVAQGSVFGPIVFILYSTLLGGVSQQIVCSTLANCFADIQQWTIGNKMMLNVGKTDVLTVSDVKATVPGSVIELCGKSITSSRFVRNLGATFEANLNMENHVSDICRRAFYHIHRIGLIRKYLDQIGTTSLISVFVLSLLDNGNSLLLGLPGNQLDRLQSVQNSAVRMINRT
jgi:hypothetical protein